MMSIAFTQWVWVLATTHPFDDADLVISCGYDLVEYSRHPRGTGKTRKRRK